MKKLRILWVEDDARKLKGLVKPLEKDGHEIITVEDKVDAIEKIENFDFDLFIIDIIIPSGEKLDSGNNHFVGLNLLKILIEKRKKVPIVVLTVVRDNFILDKIREMGINKILQKRILLPSQLKKEIYDMTKVE